MTFKVIIDKYVFVSILNLVFQLILHVSPLFLSLFGWMVSIYFMLEYFSFFVNVVFGFDLCLLCFLSMLTPWNAMLNKN